MGMSDPGLVSVLQRLADLINLAKSSNSGEERSTELNRTGFIPHLCWTGVAFWSYHFGFGPAYAGPKRWQSCGARKPRFVLQWCPSASSFVTSEESLRPSQPVSPLTEHVELAELQGHFQDEMALDCGDPVKKTWKVDGVHVVREMQWFANEKWRRGSYNLSKWTPWGLFSLVELWSEKEPFVDWRKWSLGRMFSPKIFDD